MHEQAQQSVHEVDAGARVMRHHGWKIVTADEAYADPLGAQAKVVDTPSAQGTLTEAVAWAKGLPAPRWYERNDEEVLERLFKERVLKDADR